MSHFGILTSFDHTINSWPIYKSRIHQWFIANDITSTTDETGVKRRGILLSALTEKSYKLAVDLALPKDIQDVPFEDIIKILDAHFTTKRLGFTERFKFYSAQQNVQENNAEFIARLRGLSKHCEFKDTEEALRDRFVLGLRPGPARDKLFEQKLGELTLADALEIAETTRCVQEVNDAQKWRTLPFFGGTKVQPFQPSGTIAQSGQGLVFGTQTQSSQGTIFGGNQKSSPAASFGGTQQSATTFGGTQKSSPVASFGGTQQSVTTFGGTQQSVTNFGGTQKSSSAASFESVATFGGTQTKQSKPAGFFGGTKTQTGQAVLFGTLLAQTQLKQDTPLEGTQTVSATFGETQIQTGQASTIGGTQTGQAAYLSFGGAKPSEEQATLSGEPKIQPGNP